MPYYNFERVADGAKFSGSYASDAAALAEFGSQVADTLTLKGDGPSPYMIGKRQESMGWFKTDRPVYSLKLTA